MTQTTTIVPEPRCVPLTGDDTPAATLWQYLKRMCGWHLPASCLLAAVVAVLEFAPVELQRRIIDDAIADNDVMMLIYCAIAYLVVVVMHQGLKALLMLYQGWLSESAARYTRDHLLRIHCARGAPTDRSGETVAVLGTEVDKLAGFVGPGPSGATANAVLLIGGMAYMLIVDPAVAALGLALLVPQAVLAPVMQRRLNRLIRLRVRQMRLFGDRISGKSACENARQSAMTRRLYSSRMGIVIWKALLKGALNLMNNLAPLSVLIVGGWLAIEGETTVGVLVAFLTGFHRLASPLRDLVGFYRQCAQAGVQHDLIARWM